eukprot:m.235713 g.235713  ORF g.235713 m.235713 type:complete len:126 (+) comp33669_c2_seq1:121-498(+)
MLSALSPLMANIFSFVDPKTPAPITTVDGLVDYLAQFGTFMPGGSAKPVSVSHHNQCARATVDFCMGEKAMMRGQYFLTVDDDGKIKLLAGFQGTGEPKKPSSDNTDNGKNGAEEKKRKAEDTKE